MVLLLSRVCAGGVARRGVPPSAVHTCLKYRKIKNWLSQIQDEDGLGLLPNLKLVHSWFAYPVNGKKSGLPLNPLTALLTLLEL